MEEQPVLHLRADVQEVQRASFIFPVFFFKLWQDRRTGIWQNFIPASVMLYCHPQDAEIIYTRLI